MDMKVGNSLSSIPKSLNRLLNFASGRKRVRLLIIDCKAQSAQAVPPPIVRLNLPFHQASWSGASSRISRLVESKKRLLRPSYHVCILAPPCIGFATF